MKKKIKNLLPYIIFFIMLLFIHLFMNYASDDIWFSKQLSEQSLFKFLDFRYHNWSSRIVIEAVLVLITRTNINIWRVLDTFAYTISAYCIIKFANNKNNKNIIFLGIPLVLMYPYEEMSSAGWVATTLNYSWCFAAGMLSFLPIVNKSRNEKTSVFIYIISILGLLYATNQEQSCALIFGFNSLYLLNTIIKKEKINKYNIIALLISTLALVFILTCPGNSSRNSIEMAQWYPEFKKFGLLQKSYFGIITTLGILLNNKIILTIFYIILSISMSLKTDKKIFKYFAYINIIFILSITLLRPILLNIYPRIEVVLDLFMYQGIPNIRDKNTLITIALGLYILISICLMLFITYGKKNLFPLILFIAGFMSRFIIGFSPTIFASGFRTALYLYLIIIMLTLMLISKLYEEKRITNKWDMVLKVTFIVISIYTYVNTFITI